MKALTLLISALVLAGIASAASASDAAKNAEILERSKVVVGLLNAAAKGQVREFDRLAGPGAAGRFDFKDVPFTISSFAKFGQSCTYDHAGTLAYGSAAHFKFDCGGLSPLSKTWFANAVVKGGKVTLIHMFWVPPSPPLGGNKVG